MPRQPLRHAACRGHGIHVRVAVVLAGEGDRRAVGRVDGIGLDAGTARQSLRGAAVARHGPEVAGIDERDVGAAERRLLQQQRCEGVSRDTGEADDRQRENDGDASHNDPPSA